MANGFVTTTPSVRHGTNDVQLDAGFVVCQKFTCPGSGAQDISEIGAWVEDSGFEFRLAIFTDDSGNSCPEVIVANSESATLSSEASMAKTSHTYGTNPQLTGGVDYWICVFFDNLINIDYLNSSGENSLYVTGYTAYTWPTATDWHTNTPAATFDLGIYAVYAASGETTTSSTTTSSSTTTTSSSTTSTISSTSSTTTSTTTTSSSTTTTSTTYPPVIFDEGFEGIGYEEDNWTVESGIGTINPDSPVSNAGSPTTWGDKCCYIDIVEQTYLYQQVAPNAKYWRVETVVTSENIDDGQEFIICSGYTYVIGFAWSVGWYRNFSGDIQWRMKCRHDGTSNYYYGLKTPRLDTRYRIEVKWDADTDTWAWRLDGINQPNNIDDSEPVTSEGTLTDNHVPDTGAIFLGSGDLTSASIYVDLVSARTFDWVGGDPITTTTTTSSTTTTTSPPVLEGYAFGEQNPTDENQESWATWSDGAAGSPTIIGDADWGQLKVWLNASGQSAVKDLGSTKNRIIVVKRDKYGSGSGSITIYIRGQATSFTQDEGSPSWEEYTTPVNKNWRYIQTRIEYTT